jgi:hypothetical protein
MAHMSPHGPNPPPMTGRFSDVPKRPKYTAEPWPPPEYAFHSAPTDPAGDGQLPLFPTPPEPDRIEVDGVAWHRTRSGGWIRDGYTEADVPTWEERAEPDAAFLPKCPPAPAGKQVVARLSQPIPTPTPSTLDPAKIEGVHDPLPSTASGATATAPPRRGRVAERSSTRGINL